VARAAKRTAKKAENRRGSPEAVEKRRVARQFNTLLAGGGSTGRRDGRTEKRRARLIKELKDGKSRTGGGLKPLDVILRVQELLTMGETLGSLRKVVKTKFAADESDEVVTLLSRLHKAYGFAPEAYRVVGLGQGVLQKSGILGGGAEPKKRTRKKA
jgi:hypothetical protein